MKLVKSSSRFPTVWPVAVLLAYGVLVVPGATAARADEPKPEGMRQPRLVYTHTIKDYGAEWVGFSRDGTNLFILTNELTADSKSQRLVITLDATAGKELRSLRIPGLGSQGAVSPDGTRIVLPDFRGGATVWSTKDGTALLTLKGHKESKRFGAVLTARYSPDGSKIVTGGGDKTAKLWDAATGKCLATFTGHAMEVASVEFSGDGKFIATGSYSGEIKIWDIVKEECVRDLEGMSASNNPTHFSPGGKQVVSPRLDAPAVWNVLDGERVQEFKGHESWVRTARFDPTGKWIVTAGIDKTVRVWDVKTGKEVFRLPDHKSEVDFAVFSPDGTRVITTEGTKVHVWQLPVAK